MIVEVVQETAIGMHVTGMIVVTILLIIYIIMVNIVRVPIWYLGAMIVLIQM